MKRAIYFILLGAVAAGCVNCKNDMKIETKPYPVARMDSTVDDYHGTRVADPYRWMENDRSAEVAEWVAAENAVTDDYISQIPYRNQIKERLTRLWNYPKMGVPEKVGDYYFSFRNDGLQNQSVLYCQKGLDGTPEVFLDPNTLSEDGTVALVGVSFSEDGRYLSYSAAASGSDWVKIRVMEVATKKLLPDEIGWVKFSVASWGADSRGFYYSRYDEPSEEEVLSGQNRFQKVYYHVLGQSQSQDVLVYEDPKHPLRYFNAEESGDGRYLFVSASEGTHGTEILYKDLKRPDAGFRVLFPGFGADYTIVECEGGRAWVYTNEGAPNYKLVEVNLALFDPRKSARDVIPEDSAMLESVSSVGGYLMASYLEKAMNKVYQYTPEGRLVREVDLPDIGAVWGFSGKKGFAETFYAMGTFTAPASIYRYDLASGESTLFLRPELPFDPDLYTTEQVFYPSKDGTQVSMFLVHRKDLVRNGQNPVYLYGYGGFNIGLTPGFSPAYVLMMEQGGIVAIPNLRGGNEYGEKWHRAGMLENKQNVFDDFIAAAEYLVANGYTSPEKLAIAGGSNGGLLVGACMTQRPDLFAVALPAVGVMDMLRFHKFTVGWGWVVEYGSSDDPEQFRYIYKYSPLHNIKPGTCYPATLVTTADHDDRVVPAHSFKFAATLQAAQACDKPVLIRIDSKAGHGAGKPIAKKIEEQADTYSFLFWNTDTPVKFGK